MTNVVNGAFAIRKCPPGSMAIHERYGWCEVELADGHSRIVRVDRYEPVVDGIDEDLPTGIAAEEILAVEQIVSECYEVDVCELYEPDPRRDFLGNNAATVHHFVSTTTSPK